MQILVSNALLRLPLLAGSMALLTLLACEPAAVSDPAAALEDIRQQQEAGDYQGTLEPLRELLAIHPNNAEAHFRYGTSLVVLRQGNLAVWSFREAMKDPEWFQRAASQLAFLALDSGDYNEVVAITSRILEREPEDIWALLFRANAYAHWKKAPDLALADAERVLALDPDRLEAYEPKILALLSLERLDEAREALAEAGHRMLELEPGEGSEGVMAWHCSTTAAFELEAGELESAKETWIRCLRDYPDNPSVVANALEFYDRQGEPARSIELLRTALEGVPQSRSFRLQLAQRIAGSGGVAEAEALLREGTELGDPVLAIYAWMDLGKLRLAHGELDAAADALAESVSLAAEMGIEEPQLLFEYADALIAAGRLERALELSDDLAPVHRHLIRARVAQERRELGVAMKEFDEALRLWPDNAAARYYAAVIAEELGDFDRALEEYRYSVRVSPGATESRKRGADMLLAEGQPAAALQMLQTAYGEVPLDLDGLLLQLRLLGLQGNAAGVAEVLAHIEASDPATSGRALAEAARGVARRGGPGLALDMLATAPGVDYSQPRFAAALRARVRYTHEAGNPADARPALEQFLAAMGETSVGQEIRGLDLELAAAPAEEIRAAYERALELWPVNPYALLGLGRITLEQDPQTALGYFKRSAAANPEEGDSMLLAAAALEALKRPEDAANQLDRMLLDHPFRTDAAMHRARLDLERGIASERTLERARRAARFGGGPDALELLSEVYAQRGDAELASRASERAQTMRDARDARDAKAAKSQSEG